MDFLKDLLELNNVITLEKIANEKGFTQDETKQFITKYNKRNNRLFKPCKTYRIDNYRFKIQKI